MWHAQEKYAINQNKSIEFFLRETDQQERTRDPTLARDEIKNTGRGNNGFLEHY